MPPPLYPPRHNNLIHNLYTLYVYILFYFIKYLQFTFNLNFQVKYLEIIDERSHFMPILHYMEGEKNSKV